VKKLFVTIVLFVGIASISLYAWVPSDFAKYPSVTKPGNLLINVGVGFGGHMRNDRYNFGADYIYVPPMQIAVDYNAPLFGLPFFFGGLFGYSGYGFKGNLYMDEYYYSTIDLALRFGYHFNWGIDKLDTYAALKAGWSIFAGTNDYLPTAHGWLILGLNAGARFFFTNWFGIWAEVGIGSYYSVDLGLTFKF